jgi:hypothetical protein
MFKILFVTNATEMKWQFSLIVIAEYLFFCGLKKLFMWKVLQSGGRRHSAVGVSVRKFSIVWLTNLLNLIQVYEGSTTLKTWEKQVAGAEEVDELLMKGKG